MKISIERGFTPSEFIVGLAIVSLLGIFLLPEHIRSRDASKEAETKANLHTIQLALERFATDADGEFPEYILGGDFKGWDSQNGCRAITLPNNEQMRPPQDQLIRFGYLNSYPRNPFLNEGDGVRTIILYTGASGDLGDGDVRFGWSGEIMGNCLDDPRVLFESCSMPTRYQYTMYPIPSSYLGVLNAHSGNSFYCMGGLPEWSSDSLGMSDLDGGTFKFCWPGEFFYRAGGEFSEIDPSFSSDAYNTIWRWPYRRIDKYMLGAYGSLRTEGLDVIRLTKLEGQAAAMSGTSSWGTISGQFYQDHSDPGREASHPEFDIQVTYSNPEVFGGGECGLMPQFPYYTEKDHNWMFGAPDGLPDGIILVLTNETAGSTLLEWKD